ncbi:hypothetical protein ACSNOJ_33135 [Streptomyces sp. URMC 128]|uniref:hypothetical protein n=1 Tax=Streptomyces sp. URMC 128 TaxID=3423404 RepID=UPI003F1A9A5F
MAAPTIKYLPSGLTVTFRSGPAPRPCPPGGRPRRLGRLDEAGCETTVTSLAPLLEAARSLERL